MAIELDIRPIKAWLPSLDNPLLISGPCSPGDRRANHGNRLVN